jgi:hypothetical protein
MTSQQVADKKERTLGEILVVIVLVGSLMTSFIFYFFKHQEQLVRVGFESLSHVFSARVNGIHAQWFMDSQPKNVVIENSFADKAGEKVAVPVNDVGWVDVQNIALPCQKIWQYVMASPLIYMKQPISAVLVELKGQKKLSYCQFSLPSGENFTYQNGNGKVNFRANE